MEQWKRIIDYPNYEVSNLGRIRNRTTNKYLSPGLSGGKYLTVSLGRDGKFFTHKVHRLVEQNDVGVKWISRDVVITSLVFKIGIFGSVYVLANLRGKGCPEFVNYWNLPGGFLDFDETGEQAASRETFEETGYLIPVEEFNLIETSTDPKINKQHVAFRYLAVIESKDTWNYREYEDIDKALANLTGEKDEVANISWIHIDSLNNYNWAFNHKEIILKTYKEYIKYYNINKNN